VVPCYNCKAQYRISESKATGSSQPEKASIAHLASPSEQDMAKNPFIIAGPV
jgi:hypothetical protein